LKEESDIQDAISSTQVSGAPDGTQKLQNKFPQELVQFTATGGLSALRVTHI